MGVRVERPPQGGGAVLLVDDDALSRVLYSRFLRRAGYDVVCANSGPDALQLLDAQQFDLVLLDIVMPNMTGLDVLERMPSPTQTPRPHVIMMSGTTSDSIHARCQQLGARGLLVKPITAAVLTEHIERAMRA